MPGHHGTPRLVHPDGAQTTTGKSDMGQQGMIDWFRRCKEPHATPLLRGIIELRMRLYMGMHAELRKRFRERTQVDMLSNAVMAAVNAKETVGLKYNG